MKLIRYVVRVRSLGAICSDPITYGVFTEEEAKEVRKEIESKWTEKDLMEEAECSIETLSEYR